VVITIGAALVGRGGAGVAGMTPGGLDSLEGEYYRTKRDDLKPMRGDGKSFVRRDEIKN
jgi:hypothetical protein